MFPVTHVLVQTTLWMDSGLPEDYAVNTWHINTTAVDPAAGMAAFFADLQTFYTSIDNYLSSLCEGTLAVRGYNMDDPTPRVPFFIDGVALTVGTSSYPTEVAMCLSFQGARISGENQARRRGRIYLGPLSPTTGDGATGRPTTTFRTDCLAAMDTLADDALADPTYAWVVWSEAAGSGTVVTNGWVDNAFDTQRRRGLDPTVRTSWTT